MKMNIHSTSCFWNNITYEQEKKLKDYNIERKDDNLYIQINTLEELLNVAKLLNEYLIIGFNEYRNNEVCLEIYDSYRE